MDETKHTVKTNKLTVHISLAQLNITVMYTEIKFG